MKTIIAILLVVAACSFASVAEAETAKTCGEIKFKNFYFPKGARGSLQVYGFGGDATAVVPAGEKNEVRLIYTNSREGYIAVLDVKDGKGVQLVSPPPFTKDPVVDEIKKCINK